MKSATLTRTVAKLLAKHQMTVQELRQWIASHEAELSATIQPPATNSAAKARNDDARNAGTLDHWLKSAALNSATESLLTQIWNSLQRNGVSTRSLKLYAHSFGIPEVKARNRNAVILSFLMVLAKRSLAELRDHAHRLANSTDPGADSRSLVGWSEIIMSKKTPRTQPTT